MTKKNDELPVPPGDDVVDNEPEYQEEPKDPPLGIDIEPDAEPAEGDEGDHPDQNLKEVNDE